MIHDKDYIMRIVKQFSELLATMMLGKNEGELNDEQTLFETQMRNAFKMDFDELAGKSAAEMSQWVEAKDKSHQIGYYELLGNLFYYKFTLDPNIGFALKAQTFYEKWLQESQIFSLPVMSKLAELKKFADSNNGVDV